MSKKTLTISIAFAVVLMFSLTAIGAEAPKAQILKPCSQCHAFDKKLLRGIMGNISIKAETFSVNAGAIWTIRFAEGTKLIGWKDPIDKIPREKEIAVEFIEKDGEIHAKSISVKPPAKIPSEKHATLAFVVEHVEKGDALIIDSRPAARFNEGAIPGAINIYDAEFDKHINKLPKDKNKLIIFYCAGPT
jgi:hypothetical protein